MNEKSTELFNESKITQGRLETQQDTRAWIIVCRYGYGDPRAKIIDMDRLREAVITGDVWEWRNAGEKTVKIFCEWLSGERPLPKGLINAPFAR